jgi:hypothetical protein
VQKEVIVAQIQAMLPGGKKKENLVEKQRHFGNTLMTVCRELTYATTSQYEERDDSDSNTNNSTLIW